MKKTIKVDKIRSYQTLVNKRGYGSYRTQEYKTYIQEIGYQIRNLKPIESDKSLRIQIHFKCKNKVVGDLDNITKPILDILQIHNIIKDDRKVVELNLKKTFGHNENYIDLEIKELIE